MIKYKLVNDNLLFVSYGNTKVSIYYEQSSTTNIIYKEFCSSVNAVPNSFFKNERNMNVYEMHIASLIEKMLKVVNLRIVINVLAISDSHSPLPAVFEGVGRILSRNVTCLLFDPFMKQETSVFENNVLCLIENKYIVGIYYTGPHFDTSLFFKHISTYLKLDRPKVVFSKLNLKKRRYRKLDFDAVDYNSLLVHNNYISMYMSKTKNVNNYDFSQSNILNRNYGYRTYLNLHHLYDESDLIEGKRVQSMILPCMSQDQQYRVTLNVLNSSVDYTVYSVLGLAELFEIKDIFIFAGSCVIENKVVFYSYLSNAEKQLCEYDFAISGRGNLVHFIELSMLNARNGISFKVLKEMFKTAMQKSIKLDNDKKSALVKKVFNIDKVDRVMCLRALRSQHMISYRFLENNMLELSSYNAQDINQFFGKYIRNEYDGRIIREVAQGFMVEFNNKQCTGILQFESGLYIGQKVRIYKLAGNKVELVKNNLTYC